MACFSIFLTPYYASIDQLDKADPPTIPDTYIFYLALLCLNSIADGLAGFALPKFSPGSVKPSSFEEQQQSTATAAEQNEANKKDLSLVTDMANVAWPGLLAAMSFYLTANLDEDLFQSTMRSYQNFTNVCGVLDLVTPRDAFLTNLCKNSIPIIPLLSSAAAVTTPAMLTKNASTTSIGTTLSFTGSTAAVSFADLPVHQQQAIANITLNEKNLYSLRVLLNITMFLGSVLGSSWYLVLETLQLADFLLFNRPIPKGSSSAATSGANTGATTSTNLRRTITASSTSSVSINQLNVSRKFLNIQSCSFCAFIDLLILLC